MKAINILFLGGAKRVSLAEKMIQAGLKRNCSVHIYSYELDTHVPIASVGTVVEGLKWNSPDLYTHLSDIIKSKEIHTVLPFVDAAIAVTSKLAVQHPELYIPVSDIEIADVMFDKVTANNWFIDHKLPVPPQDGALPLIAKPRKGSASKGIFILRDKDDADYFDKKNDRNDFLVQKFISGIEYTVDCYVSRAGKLISAVPRMRAEVTSGEATKTITAKDEEILLLTEKILSKGKFKGPITVQFIRDAKTLETYIMEINPRFGGGVLASIEAGADSTQSLIDELLDLPVASNTSWKENLIMTRSFKETYFYADNH